MRKVSEDGVTLFYIKYGEYGVKHFDIEADCINWVKRHSISLYNMKPGKWESLIK